MLSNPKPLIGYADTECYSSFEDGGGENTRLPKKDCGINVGKIGVQLKINRITSIRGTVCYNHGNNSNEVAMRDARKFKDNSFKLFGIRRFL